MTEVLSDPEMPKRASPNPSDPPRKRAAAAGKKAAAAPRKAANGHRLPDPLPAGEILTDLCRKQWRLGKAVGLGGFGEIYLGEWAHLFFPPSFLVSLVESVVCLLAFLRWCRGV